jgi:mRNA interferase YafQ
MRTVKYTSRFRRDYKRERSGQHSKRLDAELLETVNMLAKDEPLPRRYFDRPLSGEWSNYRDCHIRPGPGPIYRRPDAASLELVRLGSHSELAFWKRCHPFAQIRSVEMHLTQPSPGYIAVSGATTPGSHGDMSECSNPRATRLVLR